jgi:hypothetical protein
LPAGLWTRSWPSRAATRSARPRSPEPSGVGAADAVVADLDHQAAVTVARAIARCSRGFIASGRLQKGVERGPGRLGLGNKAARTALGHPLAVVPAVASGGQHHDRRNLAVGQSCGHLEPVDVGQLHVEQDQVGSQLPRDRHGGASVRGLADHLEPPASSSLRASRRNPG